MMNSFENIILESQNRKQKLLKENIQYKGYDITITKSGATVRDGAGKYIQEFSTEEEAKEYIDSIKGE